MLHQISQIVCLIIAGLYGLTAIYYFCAGLLFSLLLFNIGSLFCAKNIISSSISTGVDTLGNELLPIVNPVLSASISGNRIKGFIITGIGLVLGLIAALVIFNNLWGLIGVLAFSVLEVLLGLFFYMPRDQKTEPKGKSGMTHIVMHSIIGVLIALGYFFL